MYGNAGYVWDKKGKGTALWGILGKGYVNIHLEIDLGYSEQLERVPGPLVRQVASTPVFRSTTN